MHFVWRHKSFEELSNTELYTILKLRVDVFVIEQECIYPELDDKDLVSEHLWAEHNDKIVAYARIIPAGVSYPQASIGRVIVSPEYRNIELGKALMDKAIKTADHLFHFPDICIGAQSRLHKFYESFGFEQSSEEYPDYGIMHIDMIRKNPLKRNGN